MSSIDFCEINYYITNYIAEFHNTWSSILMIIPPFIGLFYSNPANELRTTFLFISLIFTFIGSALFHATLKSFEQSLDEIGMLILNNCIFYSLLEYKQIKKRNSIILLIILLTIIQIFIYCKFQHIYYIFLLLFISLSTFNILWATYIVVSNYNNEYSECRNKLYNYAIYNYTILGAPLWIFEMYNCSVLLPYYKYVYGCTLHVFWHVGSGLGAYFLILFITYIRLEKLGGKPKIKWIMYLPVITLE